MMMMNNGYYQGNNGYGGEQYQGQSQPFRDGGENYYNGNDAANDRYSNN